MSQVWYASERMHQGMRISTIVNDTIIQISILKLKAEGYSIDEDLNDQFHDDNVIFQLLQDIVKTLESLSEGGKNLFSTKLALREFAKELVRIRAGDIDQLTRDLELVISDLRKINSTDFHNPDHALSILNEIFNAAINSVDHNMELVLIPTG